MKRLFFAQLIALFTISSSFAELWQDENFEYPLGGLITGQPGPFPWIPFSGIGINPIIVVPGLEFPCYGCNLGEAAEMHNGEEDVYRFLYSPVSAGSVYTSFVVKVTEARTGVPNGFFIHLGNYVANNANKIGRVFIQEGAAGKFAFGLAKNNENPVFTPATYNLFDEYLVVLKYEFVPGNDNDLVSLFVIARDGQNCTIPEFEPATATLGPLGDGENDLPNVGKIVLVQGSGAQAPNLIIDGICVSSSWDEGALPVELASFTAAVNQGNVSLSWSTANEINNRGFEIERSNSDGLVWQNVGSVAGNGNSNVVSNYSFTDRGVSVGSYKYRLKQIDFNGNFEYFGLNSLVQVGVPNKIALNQNYPNPFNPTTTIGYTLPVSDFVTISVYDMSGRLVATLMNAEQEAGFHRVEFNGSNLTSGVYVYRMQTKSGFMQNMKLTLIK